MTEIPRDNSDSDTLLDGELAVALTHIDVVIEQAIRRDIGDQQYDDYEARKHIESEIDNSIPFDLRFRAPLVEMNNRAATIAKDMIEDGVSVENANRNALYQSLAEFLASRCNPEDDAYLDSFGVINEQLTSVIEQELQKKYPDIQALSIGEGMLNLSQVTHKTDTLQTILTTILTVDGAGIKQKQYYEFTVGGRVTMDLDDSTQEEKRSFIEFKQDILAALQKALRTVL